MPLESSTKLTALRQELYEQFEYRRDAIFNLLDALSSDGHKYKSVISLSESQYFPRKYSSITDSVADGLNHAPWEDIKKVIWRSINCKDNNDFKHHRFILDATPNTRPFSNCLSDRTIIHTPNPTPGNKPIGVGHQYSVLAYIPPGDSKERKTWIAPVDVQRVSSKDKPHELGLKQLVDYIKKAQLKDRLCISVADSAYGTSACRNAATSCNNLLHIFRMRSNRVMFKMAENTAEKTVGRTKKYGSKFMLNSDNNDVEASFCESFSFETKRGAILTVKSYCYEDMIFKGDKDHKASDHPCRLVRYEVFNEKGEAVFKKPLWITIVGIRRKELSINEVFNNYMDRYDIEHFFKFAKNNLMADKYQSPDSEHDESWWKLAAIAYLQLSLAKEDVVATPKPWERYLPEFKNQKSRLTSPSQTQRGFNKILQVIGTPARVPVPRGKPIGRSSGEKQAKRKIQPIIFKGKNGKRQLSGSLNKTGQNSKPKKTTSDIIDAIIKIIKNSKMSRNEVCQHILKAA